MYQVLPLTRLGQHLISSWGYGFRSSLNNYMIVNENKVLACVQCSPLNESVVQVDALVSNPFLTKEERRTAVDLLIREVISLSRKQGFKSVVAATPYRSLKRYLETIGFKFQTDGVYYLEKEL